MPPKIAGVSLRCWNREATAKFYAKLGLDTTEHQHDGPLHFAVTPITDNPVFELYTLSEKHDRDTVMIVVDSIKKALDSAKKNGLEPRSMVLENKKIIRLFFADPDGREVMLYEKEKKSRRK